jgi:hypothetical protein
MPQRHPLVRILQLALGVLLILTAGIVGPLPGPGGIFFFAAGLVLVLRNSHRARCLFARAKRRWPRLGNGMDVAMRRPSALRRRARHKAREGALSR